jgi:hypothetical protein
MQFISEWMSSPADRYWRDQAAPRDPLVDEGQSRFVHAAIPLRSIAMEPNRSIETWKLSVTKVGVYCSAIISTPDKRRQLVATVARHVDRLACSPVEVP